LGFGRVGEQAHRAIDVLALTPTKEVDMAEAKPSLPLMRQILSLSRYYARDAVKDQIRAKGHKISQYAAKDINALADALILSEPERFVSRARKDLAVRIERQLLRTFAQNSQVKCNAEVRS
jgi:hypothetical protein